MVFQKLFKILKRAFSHKKRRPRHKSKVKSKRKLKSKPKFRSKPKPRVTKKPPIIGVITHYFPKVNAAVVKLKKSLKVGEPIWIKGKVTNFRQTAASMQIDRKPIEKARPGQEIGLQVFREVRPGDFIFVSANN